MIWIGTVKRSKCDRVPSHHLSALVLFDRAPSSKADGGADCWDRGNNQLRATATRSYIRAFCYGSEVLVQLLLPERQMFLATEPAEVLMCKHVRVVFTANAFVFQIISHKLARSDWADCINLAAERNFLKEKKLWLGFNQLSFCVLHVLTS